MQLHADAHPTGTPYRTPDSLSHLIAFVPLSSNSPPSNPSPSPASDTYRVIGARAEAELKEKGSRFIAEAIPVESEGEATAAIEEVRAREHQATHHCTAFRVGAAGDIFRYNDDGEPSGTAGAPILRQIDARDLTNTLVVVTRYYGGTKLGTGGLARAYGDAAGEALARAPVEERTVRTTVQLTFDYSDTSPANQVLQQFDAVVNDRDYSAVTELTVAVRHSEVDAFVDAFTNALGGRGTADVLTTEA